MTLREAQLQDLNNALTGRGMSEADRQREETKLREGLTARASELDTLKSLNGIAKAEDERDIRVFESLMGNRKAAEFAVQGRPADAARF